MSQFRPLDSVLIKPSGPDCNLGCTYCFYLEKADLFNKTPQHRMSDEVLEELIKQVMRQSGPSVSLTWQGGEPTLMGLDFYKKAIKFELKYGGNKNVGNGLQTNGLLIDEAWCDFLNEYNWLVGLSLDGPQHIHDKYRLTSNQKPSHHIVEKTAKMMLDRGVAVNSMCCVTDYSAGYATELYNYYKSLGFTFMQFIPVVETDKNNPKKAAPFSLTDQKYGDFLCELFDLWMDDFVDGKPTISVRQFESIFHPYVGLQAPECTMRKECGIYTVIEHNGDVYSCDFFVEPQWKLGNIMNGNIIDMLNLPRMEQFGKMKSKLPRKCSICKWNKFCFGGCTKDRIKDASDNTMPRFCHSTIQLMEYADEDFRILAENWRKNQEALQNTRVVRPGDKTYDAFGDFV